MKSHLHLNLEPHWTLTHWPLIAEFKFMQVYLHLICVHVLLYFFSRLQKMPEFAIVSFAGLMIA